MVNTQVDRPPTVHSPIARHSNAHDAAISVPDPHSGSPLPGESTPAGLQSPPASRRRSSRSEADAVEKVFQTAAELFSILAAPLRLRIINAICDRERMVQDIAAIVNSSQPNISQHLRVLHGAGIVAKRRDSHWVYYRLGNPRVADLCRAVCTQIAMELHEKKAPSASGRPSRRSVAPFA